MNTRTKNTTTTVNSNPNSVTVNINYDIRSVLNCAQVNPSKTVQVNVSNIDTITTQQFRNLVIQHVREGKEGNIEPQDLF